MLNSEFIFSEKRSSRIKRHILFWIFAWLYYDFVMVMLYSEVSPRGFNTVWVELFLLVPQLLLVYPLLYFVLPRYLLNKKYVAAVFWAAIIVILSTILNKIMVLHLNDVLSTLLPKKYLVPGYAVSHYNMRIAIINTSTGGFTIAALAVGLKFIKDWYLKAQRNLQLQKENMKAQLQLLTAQVHPHFLFNTLNNIYSKAQTETPGSANMIMELSNILRYVLDEGKHVMVPLENELQMIKDYINLERQRYDDKLDLYVSFPSKTENVYIAPLLLLPFIENSFKHGTSKMLNNPWINLKIELNDTSLFMKLMNGKKQSPIQHSNHNGTGIENVRKRLDLLYKDKHTLQINEDEEVFVVNLTIELVIIDKTTPVQLQTTPATAYD
jgi:hypothetical protein